MHKGPLLCKELSPPDGTRSDLVAATALLPPLPPAALASGLVTVRLRVPAAGVVR